MGTAQDRAPSIFHRDGVRNADFETCSSLERFESGIVHAKTGLLRTFGLRPRTKAFPMCNPLAHWHTLLRRSHGKHLRRVTHSRIAKSCRTPGVAAHECSSRLRAPIGMRLESACKGPAAPPGELHHRTVRRLLPRKRALPKSSCRHLTPSATA